MPLAQLITAAELAQRLHARDLLILDCRFALEDPTYGERSYKDTHIPGAQFADLEKDLSGPVLPGTTGRHPLPDPEQLLTRLRRWGLDEQSEVVLYDDGPGAFAARAWWLLLWLGKREDVYLLDGASTPGGKLGCQWKAPRPSWNQAISTGMQTTAWSSMQRDCKNTCIAPS